MRRFISLLLSIILVICYTNVVYSADPPPLSVNAKSAVIMEASTGKILFEQNADEALPPASVTKIMTLLLIYDSVNSGKIAWEDSVSVSEHAASMGGSQIFLEPSETQTVADLTKSIAIASANDAAVTMAEYIGGSEEGFVSLMNEKAKVLGMTNTHFANACGLDDDNHNMSAKDIAIMSRELMTKYPDVKKYTTTWQDTITHTTKKGSSEFGLTNTNKLIKWYNDATGLKTGSTSKAMYCLSGTATRDGMDLIAVVMAAPDPKVRFQEVMKMLDYGFANYAIAHGEEAGKVVGEVNVYKGMEEKTNAIVKEQVNFLTLKGNSTDIVPNIQLVESINAPIEAGTKLGEIIYTINGEEVGRSDLIAEKLIEKATLTHNLEKLIGKWFGC